MSFILSHFRLQTENNQTPYKKTILRGRKSFHANDKIEISFSKEKSPKQSVFKEYNYLAGIYTPSNNKFSKKKMSLANNSLIHKRTVTETEMKNESIIPSSNQSILSPNNDNQQKYFLNNAKFQILKKKINQINQKSIKINQQSEQNNPMSKNNATIDQITQNDENYTKTQKKQLDIQINKNSNQQILKINPQQQPKINYSNKRNQSLHNPTQNKSIDKKDIMNNTRVQSPSNKSKIYEQTMNKIKQKIEQQIKGKINNFIQLDDLDSNIQIKNYEQPSSQQTMQSDKDSSQQSTSQNKKSFINFEKYQSKRLATQADIFDSTITTINVQNAAQKVHPKILWDMSDEEWNQFGDRFTKGYEKKKLLGRGGFAMVWLGENKKTKEKVAIKQIVTNNNHQTHIKEIWFGSYFFDKGQPKEKFSHYRGIHNLSKMIGHDIQSQDTFIFYEQCGQSLGTVLYDLEGEGNIGNERLYRIKYKPFYIEMRKQPKILKQLIFEIAHSLLLLSDCNIVHSDLKTENILLKIQKTQQGYDLIQTKLIDYGSSFTFGNLKHFTMATPEYMAPEILNFILYQNNLRYIPKMLQYLKIYQKSYVIDVWSLGCVFLEIISGIPLWMSLKTIITYKNQEIIKQGLFATTGRVFELIIEKQIEVIKNLDIYLTEQNFSGIEIQDDMKFLLKRMLSFDPDKRISPREICQFLGAKDQLNMPLSFELINPKIINIDQNKEENENNKSYLKQVLDIDKQKVQ